MPRLLGVDIPSDRPTVVALTYLYGVGRKTSRTLCHDAGVDPQVRARDLREDELGRLAALLEKDYVSGTRTSSACATSAATGVCGIVAACLSAASAPARMRVLAKVPRRPWPERKASRICASSGFNFKGVVQRWPSRNDARHVGT